jgi:hypothetical protein
MKHFYRWPFLTVMTLALLLVAQTAGAAPKADLWPRWEKNDPANNPVLTGMVAETGPESVAGLERKTQPRPS